MLLKLQLPPPILVDIHRFHLLGACAVVTPATSDLLFQGFTAQTIGLFSHFILLPTDHVEQQKPTEFK